MKKAIKGKTPSLITASSGKPKLVICKRASNCRRCGETITLGEKCADIPIAGKGYSANKRHCMACFVAIIEESKKDLAVLEEEARN